MPHPPDARRGASRGNACVVATALIARTEGEAVGAAKGRAEGAAASWSMTIGGGPPIVLAYGSLAVVPTRGFALGGAMTRLKPNGA